jgi:hypothetical protein
MSNFLQTGKNGDVHDVKKRAEALPPPLFLKVDFLLPGKFPEGCIYLLIGELTTGMN